MKKIYILLVVIFTFSLITGCAKTTSDNTNLQPTPSANTDSEPINNQADLPTPDVVEKCRYYNTSCTKNSDCVSITKMTSCYEPCEISPENCKTAPKCCVVNKNEILPICADSEPCKEPKNVKCVENRCAGEW